MPAYPTHFSLLVYPFLHSLLPPPLTINLSFTNRGQKRLSWCDEIIIFSDYKSTSAYRDRKTHMLRLHPLQHSLLPYMLCLLPSPLLSPPYFGYWTIPSMASPPTYLPPQPDLRLCLIHSCCKEGRRVTGVNQEVFSSAKRKEDWRWKKGSVHFAVLFCKKRRESEGLRQEREYNFWGVGLTCRVRFLQEG